jgi:hypothetical protein
MRAQCVAVDVDPIDHDCGDREYHVGLCEFSLSQNVMDQAAVETSVAVLERVDLDETGSRRRRLEHGVELSLAYAFVRSDHTLHQWRQILGTCADEFRQRITVMISLAQENAVWPHAGTREARVLDQHGMQAHDFVKRQRVLSDLQHRAAHRFSRLRGDFSPSISRLARLSSSKRKLAVRATGSRRRSCARRPTRRLSSGGRVQSPDAGRRVAGAGPRRASAARDQPP